MTDTDLDDSKDTFAAPFYLLRGEEDCWKCGTTCRVVGLAAGAENPYVLSNIKEMPEAFLLAIEAVHPQFEKRQSYTAGSAYYMNTCPCGAHFGDFYLFSEPGGPFFPTTKEEAAGLEVIELPIEGEHVFACSPGYGTGDIILLHGRRVQWGAAR